MQVRTTKDQGLYNKPSAAVHQGALAAGTLPQYSTIQYITPLVFFFGLFVCCRYYVHQFLVSAISDTCLFRLKEFRIY